jgi:small subunit ribosomal protein S4
MARYRGPKSKIARKFKDPIFGPDKALERKNYPPGMHGNTRRRKKHSEYALQLMEKQKAKYMITGTNLLQLCEARLDNTVFRLGVAPTRRAARQLVGHKHITVNGRVTNIPSYSVRPGDVIAVRERSKSLEAITASLAAANNTWDWLQWNPDTMSGEVLNLPEREQIPENIKEQLIVELYSK